MSETRIVLTTAGSADEARKIAQALVERRLAACVNVVPQIESVFRWEGKVEHATECLLLIKTEDRVVSRLYDAIKELHPYSLPEWLILKVDAGSPEYLAWVKDSTS